MMKKTRALCAALCALLSPVSALAQESAVQGSLSAKTLHEIVYADRHNSVLAQNALAADGDLAWRWSTRNPANGSFFGTSFRGNATLWHDTDSNRSLQAEEDATLHLGWLTVGHGYRNHVPARFEEAFWRSRRESRAHQLKISLRADVIDLVRSEIGQNIAKHTDLNTLGVSEYYQEIKNGAPHSLYLASFRVTTSFFDAQEDARGREKSQDFEIAALEYLRRDEGLRARAFVLQVRHYALSHEDRSGRHEINDFILYPLWLEGMALGFSEDVMLDLQVGFFSIDDAFLEIPEPTMEEEKPKKPSSFREDYRVGLRSKKDSAPLLWPLHFARTHRFTPNGQGLDQGYQLTGSVALPTSETLQIQTKFSALLTQRTHTSAFAPAKAKKEEGRRDTRGRADLALLWDGHRGWQASMGIWVEHSDRSDLLIRPLEPTLQTVTGTTFHLAYRVN